MGAVASAMPSMRPIAVALAPRRAIRNIGNRLWMISDEISMNRLTQPSTQTLRGIWRRTPDCVSLCIGDPLLSWKCTRWKSEHRVLCRIKRGSQGKAAEHDENDSGKNVNSLRGKSVRKPVPKIDNRYVRQ